MTTVTGEYTSISTQLSAISIATKHNQDGATALSSSWPSPSLGEISGKNNGEGPQGIAAGEASSAGKSWKCPARCPPGHGEVVFMEEPRSSWPVPSCDGANKKKQPQGLRLPNHVVNSSFYHPMEQSMMGIPSLAPDWVFNTVPNAQWGTNPLPSTSYYISPAPSPESMFLYGRVPVFCSSLFSHHAATSEIQGVDVRLRKQIEYYFSDENLMKDGYLKKYPRLRWKKRKGESNLGSSTKKQKQPPITKQDEEEDEDEEETGTASATPAAPEEEDEDQDLVTNPNAETVLDLREGEVVAERGRRISDFPLRSVASGNAYSGLPIQLENISHGQLQVLSAILPDHPSLALVEPDKPPAYVCTPPALMEGKGISKQFGNECLLVPVHSDWFNPSTVHRMERQVVPHFFSGKSNDHTPERYMLLRNKIVAKYLENPARKLSLADCQGLAPSNGSDLYDLSRIVRFLDHWGIINYLALLGRREPKTGDAVLREENDGELLVHVAALKSIDSLVQFDRPRSSYRPEDLTVLSSSSGLGAPVLATIEQKSLAVTYITILLVVKPPVLQSIELFLADLSLCSDCFHEGRFIVGHSSASFSRVESLNQSCDLNGDHWSDQETLLLLEALEVFNDNWNEIADHVGTKSKAQCILHFLRLPMEDGLLESIHVPGTNSSDSAEGINKDANDAGASARLPFGDSGNPLMSLVAFLAAAVGPRVGAACAGAALSVLTKEETRADRFHAENSNSAHHRENAVGGGGQGTEDGGASSALSIDKVKAAAMSGLSAAATKAKLFADQEEREIQRLVAAIVHHQRSASGCRRRGSPRRRRPRCSRSGGGGAARQPERAPAGHRAAGRLLLRRQSGEPSAGSAVLAAPAPGIPFGPRVPLSAIHPSPSSSSPSPVVAANAMASGSGTAGGAPSNHYPLLRPLPGNSNSTNIG
ncbi:unnamed protein product [Spirodela intermedia]|uniref:Uncharacterized protein n=1 Tax=Spirodela intermedia TaxID=51605 RepID=A0A7I8J1J9_SPIIN|nr:unnamed protein product [Spirodela intermedia]CAA6663842.1 unnamed protein product [Spirodela intermedia]